LPIFGTPIKLWFMAKKALPKSKNAHGIPDYIVQRVRQPIPVNSGVVFGSTPVLSFGNAQCATVATLGLNPSVREFLDMNGEEWTDELRRLATCRSLGIKDLSLASEKTIRQVVEDCNDYFHRKPYKKWFDQLEVILKTVGASYYDDSSACHLDLVQWATEPTWGHLKPPHIRTQLLGSDGPFLLQQLQNEQIKLLLVNGMAVIRRLRKLAPINFQEQSPLSVRAYQPTKLFVGTLYDRILVVGWSTNLQSSFGVTNELRKELAIRVSKIVRSN
jgi:hypothetical protein